MAFMRKGTLINKKFYHFLIFALLSNIAISLNEFVDSILVSQFLGCDAMSMVNMGFPVMLAFAVLYTMMGVGGSLSYAQYAGRYWAGMTDRDEDIPMAVLDVETETLNRMWTSKAYCISAWFLSFSILTAFHNPFNRLKGLSH